MIKFIEHSETKLRFISYPITSFVGYLISLLFCISVLYWCLYLSPLESSLTCQKYFLNRIDCHLEERSILNSHLTNLEFKNIKKIVTASFGSKDARIRLKANPNPPYIHINSFQKTYFYPSNPFSLVLFRNFNPLNWSSQLNQIDRLDAFVRGELHQQILLEQKIKGFDFIFVGLWIGLPPIFIFNTFFWLVTESIVDTYEINLQNQTLTIWCKRIFLEDITKEYKLDRIKRVRLDKNYQVKPNIGRIILEFEPDYDYPIDEFFNADEGEANFQAIASFLEKSR